MNNNGTNLNTTLQGIARRNHERVLKNSDLLLARVETVRGGGGLAGAMIRESRRSAPPSVNLSSEAAREMLKERRAGLGSILAQHFAGPVNR